MKANVFDRPLSAVYDILYKADIYEFIEGLAPPLL